MIWTADRYRITVQESAKFKASVQVLEVENADLKRSVAASEAKATSALKAVRMAEIEKVGYDDRS